MNINQLAKIIALKEGKKKSLSIAQVKEVMRCLGVACSDLDTLSAFIKYSSKLKKRGEK